MHGDVERHYRRRFEIAGYVNTSKGRINSTVKQEHLLTNTQVVQLEGVARLCLSNRDGVRFRPEADIEVRPS